MDNKTNKNVIKQILMEISSSQLNYLHDDDDLFEAGILESLTLAMMIPELEKKFNIGEIDPEEIIPENFSTVNSIACLVERLVARRSNQ